MAHTSPADSAKARCTTSDAASLLTQADRFAGIIPDLPAALRSLLVQVPPGRVATYGGLADALGSRSAARWIGEYLLDHPHDDRCCCHRVVRGNGELGHYISGRNEQKQSALLGESVVVRRGRVDLDAFHFDNFVTDRPLARLIDWQQRLAAAATLTPFGRTPRFVAGVDVSYGCLGEATGAYCVVDAASGKCVWSAVLQRSAPFPYLPGFLAFRELPVLLGVIQLAELQGQRPDLLFVDGHGILHPRRAGIATCLGVLTGLRTIGVGKKLLCGRLQNEISRKDERCEIFHQECPVGMALRGSARFRQVFVSPGHLINVRDAARMAEKVFFGHRLPEPLFHADALSRTAARTSSYSDD